MRHPDSRSMSNDSKDRALDLSPQVKLSARMLLAMCSLFAGEDLIGRLFCRLLPLPLTCSTTVQCISIYLSILKEVLEPLHLSPRTEGAIHPIPVVVLAFLCFQALLQWKICQWVFRAP